jgi:hypothetical protein
MNVKSIDPTAEEFCRIVASMIVEAARGGVRLVEIKIRKGSKRRISAIRTRRK